MTARQTGDNWHLMDVSPAKRIAAASVVIRREGRFLLVLRGRGAARGLYAFPGGKCEPGEAPQEAARRELFEETGLTVAQLAFLRRYELAGDEALYELDVFLGEGVSGTLRACDDAQAAGWFTLEEMRKLPITASTLEVAEALVHPLRIPDRGVED